MARGGLAATVLLSVRLCQQVDGAGRGMGARAASRAVTRGTAMAELRVGRDGEAGLERCHLACTV